MAIENEDNDGDEMTKRREYVKHIYMLGIIIIHF